MPSASKSHPKVGPRHFGTTRWSLVVAAGDLHEPESREALAALFQAYWSPLYAFACRWGLKPREAEDAVQGFFLRMLESTERGTVGLSGADRDRGRFRSYLLGAFRHYLGDLKSRGVALKRGGEHSPVAMNVEDFETLHRLELRDDATPESLYEKSWALTVIDRALKQLQAEYSKLGKSQVYEVLKDQLTGQSARGDLTRAAGELGIRPGAARIASLRLRRRFAETLRSEVAHTLVDLEELEDELRHLLEVLRD